jgi:hypothetical protein
VAAVASAIVRTGRCRACRLNLDPSATACWFCSTPVPAAPAEARHSTAVAASEDDGILFARGVLLGIAIVLVPFAIRFAALSL